MTALSSGEMMALFFDEKHCATIFYKLSVIIWEFVLVILNFLKYSAKRVEVVVQVSGHL